MNRPLTATASTRTTNIAGVTAWAMGVVAAQAALWLAWLFIAVGCEPGLELMLEKTDALLPSILQLFVTLSRLTVSYWYLLVVVGVPLGALEFGVLIATHASRRVWLGAVRYGAIIVFSLVPLLLLLFGVLSLLVTSILLARELAPAEAI